MFRAYVTTKVSDGGYSSQINKRRNDNNNNNIIIILIIIINNDDDDDNNNNNNNKLKINQSNNYSSKICKNENQILHLGL